MKEIWSTVEVAGLLMVPVSKVQRALWLRRITLPEKSPAGDFLWRRTDIERASWFLCHKSLEEIEAARRDGAEGGAL